MLSFPASKWTTALVSTKSSKNLNNVAGPRFGRTASLIIPRVYLSDYYTARDGNELVRLGITHVISVLEYDADIPDYILGTCRLHIPLADHPDANILVHLPGTTNFITSALAENSTNKVLVHCFQGISRSATVVCAYLIAALGIPASKALAHAQAKRGIVCPNWGFKKQLETYAQEFVEKEYKRESRMFKIGGDIVERLRQLGAGSPTPL